MEHEIGAQGGQARSALAADLLLGRGADISAIVEGWNAADRPWYLIREAKAPADEIALARFLGVGRVQ
jgi:hypothetical protein